MNGNKVKSELFYTRVKKDAQTVYYYETDNYLFPAEKPSLKNIIEKNISNKKILSNPWENWSSNDPQLIHSKISGIPLNYLKTTIPDKINEVEDRNLTILYKYVFDEFDANTPLTMKIINDWHKRLFYNIFPFAGKYRTVELHKGDESSEFPMTWRIDFLKGLPEFEKLLLEADNIAFHNINDIAIKVSEIICEFLFIHPYREGNGRISRLIGDYLLVKNDFPPVGANLKVDESEYIRRLHVGYRSKSYAPMSELIIEKINTIMNS